MGWLHGWTAKDPPSRGSRPVDPWDVLAVRLVLFGHHANGVTEDRYEHIVELIAASVVLKGVDDFDGGDDVVELSLGHELSTFELRERCYVPIEDFEMARQVVGASLLVECGVGLVV